MNVPLSWLSEYVKLPKDTQVLTDRLTDIGHMLDKTFQVGEETVIDLELRGNRADMFGLIGIAREVAAATGSSLKLPPLANLLPIDKNSPLVNVQPSAKDLVHRYTALKMSVQVGPSPDWMQKRLKAYGIESVNNVVDITNYVMVETANPLHAFDAAKIRGGQLILRRGKKGEKLATIAQGQTLTLSEEDLVIGDLDGPVALTMIGGLDSKITQDTTEIILEAAVYDQANCRRSARRLKVFTESGNRHEKHLDPLMVQMALERAVYLLKKHASGKILGKTSSYYPKVSKPKTLAFQPKEVARLVGLDISESDTKRILSGLEIEYDKGKVVVPTFRTDIEGSADIVEEVARLYGYDRIPDRSITDSMPTPDTYPSQILEEKIKDICSRVGLDEVITLTLVKGGEIKLTNPPDPELGYLRREISPQLVEYGQKLLNRRQEKIRLFEVGKTFSKSGGKYQEHQRLAIAVGGNGSSLSSLTGILQTVARLLGVETLPAKVGETDNIFWAEVEVDKLTLPEFVNPYKVTPTFSPVIEDVNVKYAGNYSALIDRIRKLSNLITDIQFVDLYEDKLTLRITYNSDTKQLSSSDISHVREKLATI